MAEEEVQQEGGKSRLGFLKWIILLVVFLGLAVGGYYVYVKFFSAESDEAEQTEQAEQMEEGQQKQEQVYQDLVTLPTFVVNLADPLGRRYLKLSMDVEVADEQTAQQLQSSEAKVRDAIILLLSSKSFQDLSSMENKIMLKKEIVERLNQVLGGPKVRRVYFTEMVVQ